MKSIENAVRDATALCVRLRKIEWMDYYLFDVFVFQALLSGGGKGVQSLRVREPSLPYQDPISSLTSLREFRCHWSVHFPRYFDNFARSNTHLEIVDIGVKDFEMDEEAVCVDVVKSFAICKSLRELYVDLKDMPMAAKRPAIVNELNVYRRNLAYVTLCEVKYLP